MRGEVRAGRREGVGGRQSPMMLTSFLAMGGCSVIITMALPWMLRSTRVSTRRCETRPLVCSTCLGTGVGFGVRARVRVRVGG